MKVDMLNIPFDEASFTLLIANHVMEIVSDDAQALREIHRVLKPGGFAILQTPFSARLDNTWEDAGIDSDEARLESLRAGGSCSSLWPGYFRAIHCCGF
ncbi:class I SAM-dependent methyltransferase [Chromatium okenii]|uniref:Methyltransferase type 11 domain-containing protein n=1 Tax=Chromatium okenii TaxID=61644 RepID=A0A2S7XSS2_9GAMM|nr:class I SAM-dependent methyltransferase [Chromatium okenii]PQJ96441.1 hypothetical protein CXB77_06125 [Chromatium okenii]